MRALISSTSCSLDVEVLREQLRRGLEAAGEELLPLLARLKKSFRWAWVVPSFTILQLSMM